jgi:methylenetetrahydrofolate reductase (NADPH)
MKAEHAQAVAELLRRPRYEVIPVDGVVEDVARHVPTDVRLTVTASPRKGIGRTLEVSEQLAGQGYQTVPHISARLVIDQAHLKDILHRLDRTGIRDVFVIAGDVQEPPGEFTGAVELLAAMAKVGHELEEIGVTGYPESHPLISDDVTIQAMWDKRHYATYIVSQICFDPRDVGAWVRRVRRRGVDLPIHVGMPGVVDRAKLLRVSSKIGLGESARFLSQHRTWVLRLLAPGGYSPGRFAERMGPHVADPANKIHGFHIYTFNELAKTERWRQALLDRLQAAV